MTTSAASHEYCTLANETICRLEYIDSNRPQCVPEVVALQPIDPAIDATLVASLSPWFTPTQPSLLRLVELDGQVGTGTEVWLTSSRLVDARVEEVALTVAEALRQLDWHEDAASIETERSTGLERTTHYRSLFTNGGLRCQSTVVWMPTVEFLHCAEDVPALDCILNSPDAYLFTVNLICVEPISSPAK